MKQKHSWDITDKFWAIAEPLIPKKHETPIKCTSENKGEAARQCNIERPLKPFFMYCVRASSGRLCPFPLALPALSTAILCFGPNQASLRSGRLADYESMMR
jgi:hypothetical protein